MKFEAVLFSGKVEYKGTILRPIPLNQFAVIHEPEKF